MFRKQLIVRQQCTAC